MAPHEQLASSWDWGFDNPWTNGYLKGENGLASIVGIINGGSGGDPIWGSEDGFAIRKG